MGVLSGLFLAGLGALALPLIYHLVRRTPRGRQAFSSLMFLSPTPPRLTRRSRLDQIFLLLLRLAAIALLVFAFSRPFFRESSLLALNDLPQRRVAILVDTSASMQRGDLWQQARTQVERDLEELSPQDEVALFSFADRLTTEVPFADHSGAARESSHEVVRAAIKKLKPGWGRSNLGLALATLASELNAASDVGQSLAEPRIIVVSDFQSGSDTTALQAYEWPELVSVVTQKLELPQTTNAAARLLTGDAEAAEDELRVRVTNAADSQGDQFFVRWAAPQQDEKRIAETNKSKDSESVAAPGEVAVYVPPGQSRVIRLPRSDSDLLADRIVLRGDDQEFDNTFYVVPPRREQVRIFYAGSDAADDALGRLYYLQLATDGDPLREVTFEELAGDADLEPRPQDEGPRLLVVTRQLTAAQQAAVKTQVERGSLLVLAPADAEAAAMIPAMFPGVALGAPLKLRPDDFFLLGEIDFTHPLFAPLASSRYSDFTKIHFWRYQPVKIDSETSDARVIARFDNGQPWLIERPMGEGRILAMTSGWNPDDSQLAVASKFVPFIDSLVTQAIGSVKPLASAVVQQPVPLPKSRASSLTITLPDGSQQSAPQDQLEFANTSLPGIYTVGSGEQEFRFSVNLAASESDTAPLALEQLEQLNVRLGKDISKTERLERIRQERDIELESRQKVWRWLLVGCLVVLIFETWWAGRASRAASPSGESVA
jgi:hypothetical protein